MLRTQIYLPENQIRQLKKIAAESNISLSEVVRRVVNKIILGNGVKTNKQQNTGQWLNQLAKEAKNLGSKGPKDLASNVDKYLYGQ